MMTDKEATILNKIEYLKDMILDYAADHYDTNQWPDELQYDFDDVETIETRITRFSHTIKTKEMHRCNKLYKRYTLRF